MSDANKAVVRKLVEEAFGKGNVAIVDQLLADNFVDHSVPPGVPGTREGMKKLVTMFRTAFPDMTVSIEAMVAEGDLVAMRNVTRGTHKGEFMGIAPTGRTITVNEQHWARIVGGKVTEHWGVEDNLGMMQQLGVVPAS